MVNQHIFKVVSNIDVRFHKYLLDYKLDELMRETHGSGMVHITRSKFDAVPVAVPPLGEQRRIVNTLEGHLSRLDVAAACIAKVPNRLDVLRLSALAHLRENLLNVETPMRSLGEVADTALGKMLDAKRSHGRPTPYLRNLNVRWGAVDVSDVQTVPLSEGERLKFALKPGDLLVCEGGEPGRCAVWPGTEVPMTFQKALHRVRVRDQATTDNRYVALMLEEFIKSGRADQMYTGTTIRHLPQEKLRLIPIPIPEIQTQLDVIKSLDNLTSSVEEASRQVDRAFRRAEVLHRSLLAAAFSGRLTATEFLEHVHV